MKFVSVLAGLTGALFFTLIACSASESESTAQATTADAPDGKAVFKQYCITCHGADGKLSLNGAKNLGLSQLNLEGRIAIITNGKNMMTPYGEVLTPEEIRAVAKYTMEKFK